ncbi:MAG: hypothetical protein IJ264_09405 [Clostridia bacterium]|nr:hypothetical protein [Clostridia bacterium]
MNNKDRLLKVLSALAAVIIVVFFAAEIYNLTAKTYATQTVYEQTVLETVDAEMFVIRDENVLVSGSGVTVPLAENGERVSKGSTIAAVFSNEASAENYVKLQSLEQQLKAYQKIDGQLSLANIDLGKLTEEIDSVFASVVNGAYYNDFSSLGDNKLSFSEKLSRRQISFGKTVDCSAKIARLQSEISTLNSVAVPSEILTAESSGYFVSKEDGYENIITVDDVDSLTPEMLKEALESDKKESTAGAIGKVIDGYNWYVAAIVDSSKVTEFSKNKTVDLIFGDSDEDAVSTYLHSIKSFSDSESLVVFRCNLMNEELASLRKVDGKIVVNEFTGLKVGRDAVRLDDEGNEGVYVRRGNIVNFRSLNIIYSEDEFVIATNPSADSGVELAYTHLKLYDEVIISGKELKNGMVIG